MSKFVAGVGTAIIAALLLAGCSKSSSTNSGGTAPQLKAPTFSGPSSTSSTADTSEGAVQAKAYAGLFNAYVTGYLGFYTGSGTQSGNTWTWSYSVPGFTATWSATADGSNYNWKLVYNGSLTSSGTTQTFSNWTVLNGNETTDGKSGNWTLYNVNSTVAAYAVTWSTASNGTLTGTIIVNDTTGAQQAKQVFTNNTDKSGELVVYAGTSSASVQVLDVKWNANGSGTWTSFDPTDGTTNSGSWS